MTALFPLFILSLSLLPLWALDTLTSTNFEHLTQSVTGSTTGNWLILFHSTSPLPPSTTKVLEELESREELQSLGVVLGTVDTEIERAVQGRFAKILTLAKDNSDEDGVFLFLKRGRVYLFPPPMNVVDVPTYIHNLLSWIELFHGRSTSYPIPPIPTLSGQVEETFRELLEIVNLIIFSGGEGSIWGVRLLVVVVAAIIFLFLAYFTGKKAGAKKKRA